VSFSTLVLGLKLLYSLTGLKSLVERWQARQQGRADQKAKDIAADESVIQKQRDDATDAGPVDPVSDRRGL
jgi:hypothetical protein